MVNRVAQRSDPGSRLRWLVLAGLGLCLAGGLAGCARTPESQQIHDSWEPVNRPVFGLNRQVDDHALGPVARGWRTITPRVVRDSISNAYRNLTFPQRFLSTLGQAEGRKAGSELARFLVNTTVGLGGFFDPASAIGLERHDESIGKMFARWGIPPGPYMVVPLLGPSTPRDAVGGMIGVALNPLLWAGVSIPGLGVLFAVNGRAQADEQIETAKRAALDYYVFARDAYAQHNGEGNWWDDSPIGAEPSDELYEVEAETDLELKIDPKPAPPGAIESTQ